MLTSIPLPGAAFWEELSGFHAKTCLTVAFLDLQVGFDARQRQLAEAQDLTGIRVRSHQARGCQHCLSCGCNSGGDGEIHGEIQVRVVLGLAVGICMHGPCLPQAH